MTAPPFRLNTTTAIVLLIVFVAFAVLSAIRGQWLIFAIMIMFAVGNLVVAALRIRESSRSVS